MRKSSHILLLVAATAFLCVPEASADILPRSFLVLVARGGATATTSITNTASPITTTKQKKAIDDATAKNAAALEQVLDAVSLFSPARPIIKQWLPTRRSIWHRYGGTVLQTALWPSLFLSLFSAALCLFCSKADMMGLGTPFSAKFVTATERLDKMWHMHFSILSFFSAFFLNAAKGYFDATLSATRSIQGRLNDLNLLATSHACRDADGTMTPEAAAIVVQLSRYVRVLSILFYSSVSRRYANLLTTEGLLGLERRELLTQDERELLQDLTPKTRYTAVFTWIVSAFTCGCEKEHFRMPSNCHFLVIGKMAELRGSCGTITDLLDARCPLSYVHFIQLLVDSFLILTPFAAVAEMGWFAIGGSFLISMFFSGLLDLSKMLYDPLDNDDFGSEADNIQTDTLIQESACGSQRFMTTGQQLPVGARATGDQSSISSTATP
jgi:hypothetical protein